MQKELTEFSTSLDEFRKLTDRGDLKDALQLALTLEESYSAECRDSVDFLLTSAQLANQIGDYTEAISSAARAYDLLRQTSEHDLLAQVQSELARSYNFVGRPNDAEREYRDVAAAYRRSGNIEGLIDTLNRIAGIRYLRADYGEAQKLLNEALEYSNEIGDIGRQAKVSGNLGQVAIRKGELQEAVDKLSISADMNGRVGNSLNLARSFLSLALAEIRLSNFDSARRNLTNALSIIRKNDLKREMAIYYEYKAELSLALDNLDDALNASSSALEIGETIAADGDLVSQSERLKASALFRLRRYDEAEDHINRALNIAQKIDEKLEIAESLKLLAEIADKKRCFVDSRQHLEYAQSVLNELNAGYELADLYERASKLSWVEETDRVFYRHMAEELFGILGLEIEFIRKTRKPKSKEPRKHIYVVEGATGEKVHLVTANRRMRSVLKVVENCKDSDIPILITGETGTGKDQLAKYIHHLSNRSAGPLIAVNCSAIPKGLAESELFGHVKGSYTNAVETRDGLIMAANGGTLFLNEIGELPITLQAKLLGCLEEKRVVRIGDTVARPVDFRLITATNRDLEEGIATGKFRQDLYFRIAVMTFELPSLRERREDIVELVKYFLARHGWSEEQLDAHIEGSRLESAIRYRWPGNVRELENEVKLALVEKGKNIDEVVEAINSRFAEPDEERDYDDLSGLPAQLAAFEKDRIRTALQGSDGVIRRAAAYLQIPEATLRSKMRKYKM